VYFPDIIRLSLGQSVCAKYSLHVAGFSVQQNSAMHFVDESNNWFKVSRHGVFGFANGFAKFLFLEAS